MDFELSPKTASAQRSPSGGERVLTVAQLNQQAKQLLERQFARITVAGELSRVKKVSGHYYMGLKDEHAQIAAVLFRREAAGVQFKLEAGLEVWARGRVTVYGPYGRYQLIIEHIEPQGAGALQAAFEALKRKLYEEGLFAAEHKRPLPLLPSRVGIVTSPTGAVVRDIVNVAVRRYPGADLLVIPSRVQGAESAPALVEAIERASSQAQTLGLDVLVVARGGGSLEDLWGFNDERVARAIAACAIPVVSAVGHEIDTTIADLVADHRAPTPSAAAEIVFPVSSELRLALRETTSRQARAIERQVKTERHRLRAARAALGDGRHVVRERMQALDDARMALAQHMRLALEQRRRSLHQITHRLAGLHPRAKIHQMRGRLTAAERQIVLLQKQKLATCRTRLRSYGQRLDALSPLAVLDRGYAIALTSGGEAVRDSEQVSAGDTLEIRLARGRLSASVTGTFPQEHARPNDAKTQADGGHES